MRLRVCCYSVGFGIMAAGAAAVTGVDSSAAAAGAGDSKCRAQAMR
jgi:23S rRNA G2069 N7-methylase RlmK/C1962 C5-methylase RlmI